MDPRGKAAEVAILLDAVLSGLEVTGKKLLDLPLPVHYLVLRYEDLEA